jgi:anti-sigma B factor antagonist
VDPSTEVVADDPLYMQGAGPAEQFQLTGTNGTTAVVATGEIDMYSAPWLWRALSKVIDTGQRRLVVDLSGVTFIDSQGLSALLRAYKAVEPEGGTVILRGPQRQARKLLELTRLDRVLTVD